MDIITKYKNQRNTSISPISKYYGNSAIDNLIQAHQEQKDFEQIADELLEEIKIQLWKEIENDNQ